MEIKKQMISALSTLLAITVSNLERITKDMNSREKTQIYDIFIANIRDTMSVDTSSNNIFDYECSRNITTKEITRKAR